MWNNMVFLQLKNLGLKSIETWPRSHNCKSQINLDLSHCKSHIFLVKFFPFKYTNKQYLLFLYVSESFSIVFFLMTFWKSTHCSSFTGKQWIKSKLICYMLRCHVEHQQMYNHLPACLLPFLLFLSSSHAICVCSLRNSTTLSYALKRSSLLVMLNLDVFLCINIWLPVSVDFPKKLSFLFFFQILVNP